MKLFIDMDGVLVRQTGRDGFDTMPWVEGGRELWDYVKAFSPIILSQLSPDIYGRGVTQKRIWCNRELGVHVPMIVVLAWYYDTAKFEYSEPDAILIDDHFEQHQPAWVERGGMFIHHVNTENTIRELRSLLGVDDYQEALAC